MVIQKCHTDRKVIYAQIASPTAPVGAKHFNQKSRDLHKIDIRANHLLKDLVNHSPIYSDENYLLLQIFKI